MKKIFFKLIPIIVGVLLAVSWTLVSFAAVQFNPETIVIYEESVPNKDGLVVISPVPKADKDFYKVLYMLPGDSFTKDFDVENKGSETHDIWFLSYDGRSYDDWSKTAPSLTLKLLAEIDLKIYVDYLDGNGQKLFFDGKMNGVGKDGNGNPLNTNVSEAQAQTDPFKLLTLGPKQKAKIHTEVNLDGESIVGYRQYKNGVLVDNGEDWMNHSCEITWFFIVKRDEGPTPSSYRPPSNRPPSSTPTTPTSSVTPNTPSSTTSPIEIVPTPSIPGFDLPTDRGTGTGNPPGPTTSPGGVIIPTQKSPTAFPPTGDTARMMFYMVGSFLSVTALILILIAMKKRRDGRI